MSEMLREEIQRSMTARAREAELRRRRASFIKRLQTRPIEKPPDEGGGGIIDAITPDIVELAAGQVAGAIKGTPRGIYELAKAPALDVRDLVTKGDITPERSAGIARSTVEQIIEDFRHPLRNPGYLLMDIASLGTAGAGLGARLTAGLAGAAAARAGRLPPVRGRQPLPHGRLPPKKGGEGGAIEHPEGQVNLPGVAGATMEKHRYESPNDVKFQGTGRKIGIVGISPPAPDGTYFGLNRTPQGIFTIVRYPGGDIKNATRVKGEYAEGKVAGAAAKKEVFEYERKEGRYAPEKQPGYAAEQAERKFLMAHFGAPVITDKKGNVVKRYSSPDEFIDDPKNAAAVEEIRQLWRDDEKKRAVVEQDVEKTMYQRAVEFVEGTPDQKLNQKFLKQKFGIEASAAKKILQDLVSAGVITKGGVVSQKRRREMTAKAEADRAEAAKQEYAGFQATERGAADPDELDALPAQRPRPSPADPDVQAIAQRYLDDPDSLDPIELRLDPEGQEYVHDGLKRIEAALQAGVPSLRYEVREKADVPESEVSKMMDEGEVDLLSDEELAALADEAAPPTETVQLPPGALGEEPAPVARAPKLGDEEKMDVVRAMPTFGTPTVAMIQRRFQAMGVKVTGKQADALRTALIIERGEDPGAFKPGRIEPLRANQPAIERKPSAPSKEAALEGTRRLVYEEGATAKEVARRLGISESAARKNVTAVNKERAKNPRMITPHERAQLEKKVDELWQETGKVPTLKAIRDATGVGQARAKTLQATVAKKRTGGEVAGRATLREMGENPRALGVDKRTLETAGIPAQFQGRVRAGVMKTFRESKVKPPPLTAYKKVFQATLGARAGAAAFERWTSIKGGSGEPTSALRGFIEAFRAPHRGGTALIAIAARNRNTGRLRDVFDAEGNIVRPAVEMFTKEEAPTAEAMKLIQRRNLEILPVEAVLSNNAAIRAFQQHRYKWMAREASGRVERVYKKVLKATPKDATRHVEYQLRELDRVAKAVESARMIPLTRTGFMAQLQQVKELGQQRAQAVREGRERGTAGGEFGRTVDTVNQMAIIGTLYMKPAYLTPNLLGQAFLVMADHWLNPVNVLHSMQLRNSIFKKKNSETASRQSMMIRAAMHEGIIGSIETATAGRSARIAGVHGAMSQFYSNLMDNWFREVSFMNEARRHGFDTPEKIDRLFQPSNQGKFVEIARRANANIIDFGRMGAKERTILRRMIFFYPWIKASSLYTARFPTQHPAQALAITGASREGLERTEEELGPLPSYLEGAFQGPDIDVPFFGNLSERTLPSGEKVPRIVNPAAASVFGSFGEVLDASKAFLFGNARESEQVSDFLSPAISLAASAIFRRDPFTGREFPAEMSAGEILKQEASQYLAPLDAVMDVRRAREYETGERDPSEVLHPYTPTERVARFVGGITPYTLNPQEARSRAFAERRSLQAKKQRELSKYTEKRENMLRTAKQVGLLPAGTKQLPKPLRDAFTVRAEREANLAAFEEELGRDLTNVDRLYADINLLIRKGKMPKALGERILQQVEDLPDPMVDAVARSIREQHFGTAIISSYTRGINARLTAQGKATVG